MIEDLSSGKMTEADMRRMPDTSGISSSAPENLVQSKANELKSYLEDKGLTPKDAKAQVNRLLQRRGVNFQLPDKTEKLA